MASQYPRGKEPACPVQGPNCLGVVRVRGSLSCFPCSKTHAPKPLTAVDTKREVAKFSADGDTAELSRLTAEPVRTLADLIRVCEIDTETWEVERWVANKWEMGSTDQDKKAHVQPLFQIKAWLKKKTQTIAIRAEIDDLIAHAKARIPSRPASRKPTSSGYMLEVSIPDLHIGKLAWGKETGEANYDSRIAERVFLDAMDALLERTASYRFESIVFPVGNDLLNTDNAQGTTTRGTPQNTDSRYQKSFTLARRLMTDAIERLRQIAPVTVLLVPGNHDTLATWHLGDSLSCYFHKTQGVHIDNEPRQRKYHQFGKVMLMFTHGDKGKRPNYPLVMATEQPDMWGATVHREAHTGHLHQLRVEELHGVKVRISPALCPTDAWHAEHMFTGNARAAEAFVWHRDEGMVGTALYTVPKDREDAA
jgi:hypothetical protein